MRTAKAAADRRGNRRCSVLTGYRARVTGPIPPSPSFPDAVNRRKCPKLRGDGGFNVDVEVVGKHRQADPDVGDFRGAREGHHQMASTALAASPSNISDAIEKIMNRTGM